MWPFTSYPEVPPRALADDLEYDYVVVGGGTTGCIIASRLSEDPSVRVLLLSRGRVRDSYWYRIPLIGQTSFKDPALSDVLESEPLPHLGGRSSQVPVCRALGGATRVNGLMVTRDPPAVFDNWAALGNKAWGWESVEPFVKKFENAHANPDAPWRGHDGRLQAAGRRPLRRSLTTKQDRST